MVDLEKLLAPISEESPTGVDLRLQSADLTFQTLDQHRTQLEPEDDPAGAGRPANWGAVVSGCEEALTNSSKDLQLAVLLTEGLTRTEGFEGFCNGVGLVAELLQTFWDQLHPGLEEEGGVSLPVRARPLSWLGSSRDFVRAAASCPIIIGADGRQFGWDAYQNSLLVDEKASLADRTQYEELLAAGYINGEEWNARLAAAAPTELREALAAVIRCQEAVNDLRALTEKQFGSDEAPDFVPLGELLFDIREYLQERVPGEEAAVEGEAAPSGTGATAAAAGGGPIASREEALRRLSEVADFFRRTEPHSPIVYIVERAVRWGHMALIDVLQEFIEDPSTLARIQDNLGIRSEPSSE